MALTRLKNVFTSKTGRCLYVNSDDFDASDAFDNRGNSPNRPFKSIQRALLEAARFSYKSGQFNDTFESFSIVLYPGDYVIDNRPGTNTSGQAFTDDDIVELSSSSDVTLVDDSGNVNPNIVLYKFNSVEGGVIVPRGTSIVGMDLRKTKLRPLYVPDPSSGSMLVLQYSELLVDVISGSSHSLMVYHRVYIKTLHNQVHLHLQHILTTN